MFPEPHRRPGARHHRDVQRRLSPDAYRDELEQIGREIENLRLLVLQSEREIETQSQRQEIAQSEVAKVEQRLQQHSHEEIRAAYAHASETEMRAFMASEQRDQMLAKLQAFERYERFLRGAVEALDSATTHAPSFPEVTCAPRIWSRAEPESTPGQYANAADEDDEYETTVDDTDHADPDDPHRFAPS